MPNDLSRGQDMPKIIINGKEVSPQELKGIDPTTIKTIDIRGNEKSAEVAGKNMKGFTWVESSSPDGKKVVTVSMDSVFFEPKGSTITQGANTYTFVPANANVQIKKLDTIQLKTVVGHELKGDAKTIVVTTSDANSASAFLKDPKTVTVTVNEADGGNKKSYTIIQKKTESTALPKDILYIVDGKEVESGYMKDLNPDAIKMVNVLKGEAAVKKYGEKAKNGVVEITTKK